MFRALFYRLFPRREDIIERYLAESTSLYDLERRERELEAMGYLR